MTAASNPMSPLPSAASASVVGSIRQAARATDIDFGLLMAQAQQESGFKPDAKASGSSATGLFQFIDATWLGLVQRFGDKYGLGALAARIHTDAAGRPVVADAAMRQRILDLRRDPRFSAALAAEFARENKIELEQALGRPAGNTELYLAHFLGAGGAISFLKAVQRDGGTAAAGLLPEAAAVNRAVFYDAQTGRARSVAEIYESFSRRIGEEAQRFAETDAGANGDSARAGVSPFIRNLGFDGRSLSEPLAAMLNVFAFAALKLLDGPPSAAPATGRATHPLPDARA